MSCLPALCVTSRDFWKPHALQHACKSFFAKTNATSGYLHFPQRTYFNINLIMIKSVTLLVKQLLEVLQSVLTFDDSVLLLIGTNLSTKILNDNLVWHSEGVSYIFKVYNVCFDTVQTTFLFQNHYGHGVSIILSTPKFLPV